MKPIKAWAVVTKYSEIADVIAESSNGVLIPFFSTKEEANEWRSRKLTTNETKVVYVVIREKGDKDS